MTRALPSDFDAWLCETFAEAGPCIMLFVLLRIVETGVDPLRSA